MLDYNTVIIIYVLCLIGGMTALVSPKMWFFSLITLFIGLFTVTTLVIDPTMIMGYINDSGVAIPITQTISEYRIFSIIILLWNIATVITTIEVDI